MAQKLFAQAAYVGSHECLLFSTLNITIFRYFHPVNIISFNIEDR